MNLVEPVSTPGNRRAFYPPLASIPPGKSRIRNVQPQQFNPEDDPQGTPDDPIFRIGILPTQAGFSDDDGLPDPAFRLHAMAPGTLRFKPANPPFADRLILEMPVFQTPTVLGVEVFLGRVGVRWWRNWMQANCIPYRIIYENVDRNHLETLLRALPLGTTPLGGGGLYGLSLPLEVQSQTDRNSFVNDFLAGNDDTKLTAEAGAVIGTAARDPNVPAGPNAPCMVRLRSTYSDHTDRVPHPMNPREFLYLLFGNDSAEARNHPLLLRMDTVGTNQAGLETKTIRLRPPLRTHARVIWEADVELNNHAGDWARNAAVGPARLYNTHNRENRRFNRGAYDNTTCNNGCFKCNIFISDIPLRAGFRVCINRVGANLWHYINANTYTGRVHNAMGVNANQDYVPVRGMVERTPTTWGWKNEQWLRSIDPNRRQQALNTAMNEEGRCFILGGARLTAGQNIGHIVIVASVDGQPILVQNAGNGLNSIRITTREARAGAGASSRVNEEFSLQGAVGGAADSTHNFTRLHLFELAPGEDPDTSRGLKNCNVEV